MIKSLNTLFLSGLLFTASAVFNLANAAILDLQTLSVDTVSAHITAGAVLNTGATTSIVPPADIIMGSYQSSILNFSNAFTGGTLSGNIYSTDAYGMPAPSGTIDTAGGFNTIDLSSLRLSGSILITGTSAPTTMTFDSELWPINTQPTLSNYNHTTGDFSLSWLVSQDITYNINTIGSQTYMSTLDITISGKASVVPVPAALWLFASGLLALSALIRLRLGA